MERPQAQLDHPSTQPVSLRTKLAYGIGQGGEGLLGRGLETFLLFYYSQVMGLPATLVGVVSFLTLLIDMVLDLTIGLVSDNWRGRMGRRHPFMYAAVLPFGLSFYLLFSPPPDLQGPGLIAWFVAALLLARIAMGLYHVPHMAQGAELSDNPVERAQLAASRVAFAIIGGVTLNLVAFGYFFRAQPGYPHGQLNPDAYGSFAVFFGVMIFLAILVSAVGTHRDIPRMHQPPVRRRSLEIRKVPGMLVAALRLPSYRVILAQMVIQFVGAGLLSGVGLYFYTYLWQLRPQQIMLVGIAQPIGLLLGFFLVGYLGRRFEKRSILAWGVLALAMFQSGPLVLWSLGLAPTEGGGEALLLLIFFQFCVGLTYVQCVSVGASMMADVADELEYVGGSRQEGVVFAGVSIAQKSGGGCGDLLLGILIDLIAFPRGAKPGTVPLQVLEQLAYTVIGIVLLMGTAALIVTLRYRLTSARHVQLLTELRARRGARVTS